MNDLTIRPRTNADLPAAAKALVNVHETDGYPVEGVSDPEGWLQSDALLTAFVAELDGRIVGHVAITRPQNGDAAAELYHAAPGESIAMLGRLFVVSDARGVGAARQLMGAAAKFARDRRMRLLLDVMEKDKAAIRLYERLGWTRLGATEHDAGDGRSVPALAMLSPAPV